MSVKIVQFPCLQDNYGFLVRDEQSGAVAAIDAPDPHVILAQLTALGWTLSCVLTTHWHADHAGGNALLRDATGARIFGPREIARHSPLDVPVDDADEIMLGATRIQVLNTGGHTLEHVSYYLPSEDVVFVGDTLFALGCGRVFEGTFPQMWESLCRLMALPDRTDVYCAHEYTQANARFASRWAGAPHIERRFAEVAELRRRGVPTVPTQIGIEKATNPFLRVAELFPDMAPAAAFEKLRTAKDHFTG
ncbi:hydroxyacylglutathione hydrolase [Pandoraea anhela]|uniref:Hydroxyacylglutathione hydrolase n=1 Tax=Pandoraea anhela TaxID=2508295 RepID=A0A5E4WGK3_9BURK|nr:hydroxyacylglutathione hydrolase [Pandoraea anhela]VVE22939.1 hydroxyacylglutathione hydrolase [Pandoraea anhela]